MRIVFADTCYWIALLNPRDQTHKIAVTVSKGLGASRIVTTDEVLTELLNYFSARGPFFRGAAAGLVERMQADRSIRIAPQTHESFLAGCRLYRARPDKGYSLTDCISMAVMRREGLSEALTNDEHYIQEGFTCLLGGWLRSQCSRHHAARRTAARESRSTAILPAGPPPSGAARADQR